MAEERSADPVMDRITAAVERSQSGDTSGARADFAAIWAQIGPDADPFHRCTLAHFAADVQDDPHEELAWDRHALAAAREVTDARVKEYHPQLAIEGFFPSLHLGLAEDLRKLGHPEEARTHLDAARAGLAALPEGGYGDMIRGGLERVASLLDPDDPPRGGTP